MLLLFGDFITVKCVSYLPVIQCKDFEGKCEIKKKIQLNSGEALRVMTRQFQ